jgi:hypothetical protein
VAAQLAARRGLPVRFAALADLAYSGACPDIAKALRGIAQPEHRFDPA